MRLTSLAERLSSGQGALWAMAVPIVVGLAISTAELLHLGRELDSSGLYGWDALEGRLIRRSPRARLWHRRVFAYRVCRAVLWVRLVSLCALGALTVVTGRVPAVPVLLVLASQLYLVARHPVGADGSDQMFSLLLVTLAIATSLAGNPIVLHACLWFTALQAALAYASSGVAKLVSPMWRSGYALFRIVCTETYGAKWAATLLQGRPQLCRFLSWSVIVLEMLFPLVLLLPAPYALVALALPLAFHVGCAVVMGLNSFIWAFPATYPAVIFCAAQLRSLSLATV